MGRGLPADRGERRRPGLRRLRRPRPPHRGRHDDPLRPPSRARAPPDRRREERDVRHPAALLRLDPGRAAALPDRRGGRQPGSLLPLRPHRQHAGADRRDRGRHRCLCLRSLRAPPRPHGRHPAALHLRRRVGRAAGGRQRAPLPDALALLPGRAGPLPLARAALAPSRRPQGAQPLPVCRRGSGALRRSRGTAARGHDRLAGTGTGDHRCHASESLGEHGAVERGLGGAGPVARVACRRAGHPGKQASGRPVAAQPAAFATAGTGSVSGSGHHRLPHVSHRHAASRGAGSGAARRPERLYRSEDRPEVPGGDVRGRSRCRLAG